MNLYLYKNLEGLGFSGTIFFKGKLLTISIGKSNGWDENAKKPVHYPAVQIYLTRGIANGPTAIAGEYEVKVLEECKKNEIEPTAFKIFKLALTPEIFAGILQDTWERGENYGKNDKLREIREVLGI